jgi:hypothetical protein
MGVERPNERLRPVRHLLIGTGPTCNADEATRIAEAAEGGMREHQPTGYTPTPEESQTMSILHSRRQEAGG